MHAFKGGLHYTNQPQWLRELINREQFYMISTGTVSNQLSGLVTTFANATISTILAHLCNQLTRSVEKFLVPKLSCPRAHNSFWHASLLRKGQAFGIKKINREMSPAKTTSYANIFLGPGGFTTIKLNSGLPPRIALHCSLQISSTELISFSLSLSQAHDNNPSPSFLPRSTRECQMKVGISVIRLALARDYTKTLFWASPLFFRSLLCCLCIFLLP